MKLFCTDGTTIECTTFRAVDSGVLLFQEEEPDGDPGHQEADGFVPITQVQYVLPDEVQPGQTFGGAQQMAAGPGGQQPGQQAGGQPQRGTGMEGGPGGPGGRSGGQQSGPGAPQRQR